MEQHFVTFLSPGTFVAEETTELIGSWDVDAARERAGHIKERYGATPYGFRFTTRARGDNDLDSKVVATSCMYYLGGKVETLEEIEARADPKESILRSNMRCNNWPRVWTSTSGWRWTQALKDDDVVLTA